MSMLRDTEVSAGAIHYVLVEGGLPLIERDPTVCVVPKGDVVVSPRVLGLVDRNGQVFAPSVSLQNGEQPPAPLVAASRQTDDAGAAALCFKARLPIAAGSFEKLGISSPLPLSIAHVRWSEG